MIPPYAFPRGATIVLAIEAIGAGAAELAGIDASAVLKRAAHGRGVPAPDAPIAATFAVTERPAGPGVGAGWAFTIPAEVSAALDPGLYVTNAVFALPGGAIEKSGLLWLQIDQAL